MLIHELKDVFNGSEIKNIYFEPRLLSYNFSKL